MKELIIHVLLHVVDMLLPAWQKHPDTHYVNVCQTVSKEVCNSKKMSVEKYINHVAELIVTESKKVKINPVLTAAIIRQESAYDSNAVGKIGEKGLCQLHGVAAKGNKAKLFIPAVNIRLCVENLSYCRQKCGKNIDDIAGCHNTGKCVVQPTRYTKRVQKIMSIFELQR